MFGEPTSRTWTVHHQFFPTLHNDFGLLHTFAQGISLMRAFLPVRRQLGNFYDSKQPLCSCRNYAQLVVFGYLFCLRRRDFGVTEVCT
jgi:hypothetical protein